jgi:voltage-gated potassium channel
MNPSLVRIRRGAVVLGVVVVAAVCGYRAFGWSWLESVYMVVITVATVGYGERSDLSPGVQAFTILVILSGISAAAYTFGGFVQMMTAGEIEKAIGSRRRARDIENLNGHVVVCGFGRIGQILCEELSRHKRGFVVIDNNQDRTELAQQLGYLTHAGDATEEEVLLAVGVARAKTLVTALNSDAANVFITLTSRNLNRSLQIIARGEFPSTQKKLLQAGADRVVLPAATGAQRMANMIIRPSTVELLELVAGHSVLDVQVDEVSVPATSPLVGKTVLSAETRSKHGLLVVAVKRAHGAMVFNPDGDFAFEAGDTVIAMGKPEHIARFREENRV